MNKPEVMLVRHGQTEWSQTGQHTGRTDLELLPAGEEQARALAPVLGRVGFDLVLTSPRQRAQRTAELAGLAGGEVDEDLAEWDYGDFEGMTTKEIRAEHPDWSVWHGPWRGGETDAEVAARADRVIARCLKEPTGSKVVLVAHGHILRVLGARWVGAEVQAGRWLTLGTAAVCRLGWEHDYRSLQLWNWTTPAPASA